MDHFEASVRGDPKVTIEIDSGSVTLDLPPAPQYIGLVRSVTTWAAAMLPDLCPEKVADLKVAVSEACTNAIEAHQRADVQAPVHLRLEHADDALTVVVEDQGHGFDPRLLPPRPPRGHPGHLDMERGWGVQLMQALVDEVHYAPTEGGTELRLVVRPDQVAASRLAHPA